MSKTISFLRFPLICIVVFIHTDLSDIHMAGRQIVAAGEYVGYETFRHFLQQLFLLAVPAFFAISGYLFFNWQGKFTKDVYVRKIGKRVRTLLVPYLLWNLIVWAVNTLGPLLLPSLAAGRGATLADYDLPRFLMAFWDTGGGKPVCIQLWFLRDLIVTCLVSPVIYYGLAHGKHWLLLLLAALFATDILPSVPGLNIAAIFPFALGAWWRRRETLTLTNNETLNTKHETLNQVSDKQPTTKQSTTKQPNNQTTKEPNQLNEQSLYIGQDCSANEYVLSKFLAERAVLQAVVDGLDAKVIRLGNLSPRTSDSRFQRNADDNTFMRTFKGFARAGAYPKEIIDVPIHFEPIDDTARAFLLLANAPKDCVVLHCRNASTATYGDMISAMKQSGMMLKGLSLVDFAKKVETLSEEDKTLMMTNIVAYGINADSLSANAMNIDSTFSNQLLSSMGFEWTQTNGDYLSKCVTNIIKD